jgi:hypothetical protein
MALLIIHTVAWFRGLPACTDRPFLTDVFLSGCPKVYGAFDFVIYGVLAFLAVAVFGRPGQIGPVDPSPGAAPAPVPGGRVLATSLLLAAPLVLVLSAAAHAQGVGVHPGQDDQWRPARMVVKIGFRTDVEPFSYEPRVRTEPAGRQYDGYLAELCYDIFAGGPYRIAEVPVRAADDRLGMLRRHEIDVLCDPTTMRFADQARWQAGIFSPVVFASGISYLKKPSRRWGEPTFVGFVEGTTSVPLAHRSCSVNLFKVVFQADVTQVPAACAVGRAEEKLLFARRALDAFTTKTSPRADMEKRLATAIDASIAAEEGLRTAPRSTLDSDEWLVEYLDDQEKAVSKALDELIVVAPCGTDGCVARREAVGRSPEPELSADTLTEISAKVVGLLAAFGSPCEGASGDRRFGVQYRFCPFRTHGELVQWFCSPDGPPGTRIYMGDREIILGKLGTWRADNLDRGGCPVEDDRGADDLSYEPYALITSRSRTDVAEFVQRRIYAFFSNRDYALGLFRANFGNKVMSPALAYLFLLNGVDDPDCFKRPATAFADPRVLPDASPCAPPEGDGEGFSAPPGGTEGGSLVAEVP